MNSEQKPLAKKKKLGEVLRDRGDISPANLAQVVADQQGKMIHLGELMLERGLVSKTQLASAIAEVTRVPYVDCAALTPSTAALQLIPKSLAMKCASLPIEVQEGKLVLVMAEPQNLNLADQIRFKAGMNLSPRMGFRNEIIAAIDKFYGVHADARPQEALAGYSAESTSPDNATLPPEIEFVSTSSRQANRESFQEVQAELLQKRTPAVRIMSEVIQAASEKRASDIHIEPQAEGVTIRIRVDGVLRDLRREPRAMQNTLVSRIKVLSDMDIAERRAPQDGRFLVRMPTKEIDFRVSTLPTQYGEKVVMRLLDSSGSAPDFANMKLPDGCGTPLCAMGPGSAYKRVCCLSPVLPAPARALLSSCSSRTFLL